MKALNNVSTLLFTLALLLMMGCQGADQTPEMQEEPMDEATTIESETLQASLSGDAEVPGPGDEDGSGSAEVVLTPADGTVCYELSVENIEEPQAAHIHTGSATESGPPVVDFDLATNGLSGCVNADEETIRSILESPSGFYVNVHNAEFGGGAVRGQLEAAM